MHNVSKGEFLKTMRVEYLELKCLRNYLPLQFCLELWLYNRKKQRRWLIDPSIMYLYSTGRSAISISWSDFPFVSTTCLFTKNTAIKQNVPKTVYRTWAPICSSNGRKSKPTKKFITYSCPNQQECETSTRFLFS